MELSDLNTRLANIGDPRPWIALIRVERCTNCGSERRRDTPPMREERKGHYVKASSTPPAGTVFRTVEAICTFAWCDKCSGERPLKDSISDALISASSDRDLAQRVGHILADFFKRKRAGASE